jgi:predicted ABC-type ATPase
MKPVLLVIAGPNGSGKTTVTVRLRAERWSDGVEYLNPDEIARDRFGDWNSPSAVKQAAEWTEARREELLLAGQGIAFETVFSTSGKTQFLHRAKKAGYFIRFFFIGTSDPRINAARVAGRVMEGGHTVPIEKIISRYSGSMANLAIAIQLADRVYLYDNSVENEEARLCARTQDGLLRKVYAELPEWIATETDSLLRHESFVDLRPH